MKPKEPEVAPAVIEACRRGDRDAFRLLYEAYKDKVYSMALYFFHGDTSTAADVTQQVFLKLLGNIGQFRGESGFSTWLYRYVANACVDRTRRAGARARHVDPEVLEQMPGGGSIEQAFEQREIARSVQAAVSTLSPKIRVAVVLRYFEDLSYGEIAGILQVSTGTVASRLSRAHQLLADALSRFRKDG